MNIKVESFPLICTGDVLETLASRSILIATGYCDLNTCKSLTVDAKH